jgi:hypothetical protein
MSIKCPSLSLAGAAVELRKSRRYRLSAPATFSWEGSDGRVQEGTGMIRDISDRGVYVAGKVAPPFGALLEVKVHLRSFELGGSSVELCGEGTVVRIDRETEHVSGFAAAVVFRTEAGGGPTPVKPERVN